MAEEDARMEVPPCPSGLFNLVGVVVEDADEEVMELYMSLATSPSTGGLGFLDARSSRLEFDVVISSGDAATKGRKGRKDVSIPMVVQQDLNLLKGSSGDTGSVLWRSSLHLGRHLLSQHHFPPPIPLFDRTKLATSRILELGSGTGVLASLLAPLCDEFVASDRYENLRLLQRNLELNRPAREGKAVTIEEIDWKDRGKVQSTYDLVLAVDCIYNEDLVQPLVSTLGKYCPVGSKTVVWVVVELRSSDVLTVFLEAWLTDQTGGWRIVRLSEGAMGLWDGVRAPWVGWVGWRL